ncbi:MAG: hypothetical protein ACXAAM_00860 [Candidatus Heimdallarchaeaceae archaeon]|jgi:hypothetical protein
MAKRNFVYSGSGKLALFFLIIGVVGVVFQFIFLYLPLLQVGAGDTTVVVDFIFSVLALAFGSLAVIMSVFVIPRNLWILFASFVFIFTIIPPVIFAIVNRMFPYVSSFAYQFPYFFVVPTNPLLDFIGFWMAVGGGLFAMLIGFNAPKK